MGWSMDWVHGPGPWGGPWTRSIGWSMDPGPCFVYVQKREDFYDESGRYKQETRECHRVNEFVANTSL